jgi:hypothetical protein
MHLNSSSSCPSRSGGVEIPKPGGGVRKLSIPTGLDRFVQQAALQVLQLTWEPTLAVPRRVVRLLWLYGSAVELQGAGLLDPPSAALLPVEAMGSASIPGTALAWGEPGSSLAHGQIRSWAVAFEPQPGIGDRAPWRLLRQARGAASPSKLPSRTASTDPPYT